MPSVDEQEEPHSQASAEFAQRLVDKLSPEDRAFVDAFYNPTHRSELSEDELVEFAEGWQQADRDKAGFSTIDRSNWTEEQLQQEADDFIAQLHQQ